MDEGALSSWSGKKLVAGEVRNLEPDLLDGLACTYQICDGPLRRLDAVRDRGGYLTACGDFGTRADLASADVPPGCFATCLAEGLLRLGCPPARRLTVDVRAAGPDPVDGAFYPVEVTSMIAVDGGAAVAASPEMPLEEKLARVIAPGIWRLLEGRQVERCASWEHERAASLVRAKRCIALAYDGRYLPRGYGDAHEYETSDGLQWVVRLDASGTARRFLRDTEGREHAIRLVARVAERRAPTARPGELE